jgi:hypothetical protein
VGVRLLMSGISFMAIGSAVKDATKRVGETRDA